MRVADWELAPAIFEKLAVGACTVTTLPSDVVDALFVSVDEELSLGAVVEPPQAIKVKVKVSTDDKAK